VIRALTGLPSARRTVHRERRGGSAIEIAPVRIALRARLSDVFHREEVDEIVDRGDEFEPLDHARLHRQQNRLSADRRIELERLRRDRSLLHQHVAGAAQNVLGRGQITDSPARGAAAVRTFTFLSHERE
jgi:hypothetical protein